MKVHKKFIALLIAALLTLSLSVTALAAEADTGFSDVAANAWYAESVKYVRDNGLMSGTTATTFEPTATTSRAMLVTVLYRQAGSPVTAQTSSFSDVTANLWYSDAVSWAAANDIVGGYPDGRFGPTDPVTRQQLAAILWRSARQPEAESTETFADQSAISAYAAPAVAWARENGIVSGKSGNLFDPAGQATRAETAAILHRFVTMDAEKPPAPHTGGQTETQPEMEESDMLNSEPSDSKEGGMENMSYHTQEIWCKNGQNNIYGIAYIPETEKPAPLIIFSHELGNSHTSGVRYAEQLAETGYAAYVFDFCGGSAPGRENKSDGSNIGMSIMTEVSDLETVLETARSWDFTDPDKVFLLGGSQGGLVTAITGSRNQDQIAGMMLMYPALSAKDDINIEQYTTQEDVPSEVGLFGGWMRVGKNYVTDIWDIDFYNLLSSYKGEMLLLHGDKDATVPLSYSEKAKNVIPHCEFHVIEGGGHEFYGKPFEDATEYILSYIQTQLEASKE